MVDSFLVEQMLFRLKSFGLKIELQTRASTAWLDTSSVVNWVSLTDNFWPNFSIMTTLYQEPRKAHSRSWLTRKLDPIILDQYKDKAPT